MCSSALFAADSETPLTVISKLQQTGEVSCQPALPFFCSNIHVSCAGQTSIAAFAFKLRATPTQGSIESAPETEALRKPYDNSRVEWDKDGRYVIVFSPQANGYIKLQSDGSYSFRYYAQKGAVMSLGRCQ